MSLILLAISLSIALAFLAFRFAVFALPVMVAIGAFQHFQSGDGGLALSAAAALAAALAAMAVVLLTLWFARHPVLQLGALGLFAAPAAVAGYALAHGVARQAIDPGPGLTLLSVICGGIVAMAAIINILGMAQDLASR